MGVPQTYLIDVDFKSEHVGLFAEEDLFSCVSWHERPRFGTASRSDGGGVRVFAVRCPGGPR